GQLACSQQALALAQRLHRLPPCDSGLGLLDVPVAPFSVLALFHQSILNFKPRSSIEVRPGFVDRFASSHAETYGDSSCATEAIVQKQSTERRASFAPG